MRWTPHVTVATVIEKDGRFLLVEEWSGDQLVFNQPAGHVEPNETFANAAVREALEETGWDVELSHISGIYVCDSARSDVTYQRICYAGKAVQHHEGKPLDTGIERAVWLTLDELKAQPEKHRSPVVVQCIEDYIAGKNYPIDLVWHYQPQNKP
jgi:ADP-ribose pyrophosphatase YjhB (NUDIX family)